MHKRIRELVRQAGLDDADFPIENWDNVPLAKFAELMVRDCIRTLCSNGYDDAAKCLQDIHFGIENPV